MPDLSSKPYSLAPEDSLIETLPEHQRKRFMKALDLMHQDIGASISWEEIATQSAISPFHFHRQFTQLFHETPGHYLSRVRLQFSVSMLFENKEMNVTDIALYCGFSSSQALAKALKRDLNMTAKAIRKLGNEGDAEEVADLLNKLAHKDGSDVSIENQLAETMPCQVTHFPQRAIKTRELPDVDFDTLCLKLGSKMLELVFITPIKDIKKSWNDDNHQAGSWIAPSRATANQKAVTCETTNSDAIDAEGSNYEGENNEEPDNIILINAGHFICAEVYVTSDIGYVAALDGIYYYAERYGLEIDPDGYCLEQPKDIEWTSSGGIVLSLQVSILA